VLAESRSRFDSVLGSIEAVRRSVVAFGSLGLFTSEPLYVRGNQKAAGTGKVVAVGACVVGGSLRNVKIRKLDEKTTRPDAVYTTDYLEAGGQHYVEGQHATFGLLFVPVKDLLAFAKARQKTKTDNK
jgi:hypothetical protein